MKTIFITTLVLVLLLKGTFTQRAANYQLHIYYDHDPRESRSSVQSEPHLNHLQHYTQTSAPKVTSKPQSVYYSKKPSLNTKRPIVARDSSEEENHGPDETFYKNFHLNSNEDSGSVEEESKESYTRDSSRSGNTPQVKRGPVYSYVKTKKGNFNWGVQYPA